MVPLYILGMLKRFGPMHGYRLKKLIAEQLSDFADIKLPTLYYHLERLAGEGFVSANAEKPGARPEKTVYAIAEAGVARFRKLLFAQLDFVYRPTFPADGAFYFSDDIDPGELVRRLDAYVGRLETALAKLEVHRAATVPFIPPEMRAQARIIFDHHARHYEAERDWARASAALLNERSSI